MRTYDKNNPPVPVEQMMTFRKTTVTSMTPIIGPCTVITQEGPYDLPPEWHGWLAVDDKGYPYPISADTHAQTYVEVDENGEEVRF